MNRPIFTIRLRLAGLLFCLLLFASLKAQVPAPPPPFEGATLSILNQGNVGSDFYFDLYLRATTGTPGNLYLANADFILTFNNAHFSSPALSKVAGFCTFVPNNAGNAALCQALYQSNTSVSISGNELRINLNTVVANDADELNDNIANINTSSGVHRLGRFRISGISNPSGTAGLQWKTATPGVFTDVYYYATNFNQYRAALTVEAPANALLPLELLAFDARAAQNSIDLDWKTAIEHDFSGFELQRSVDGHTFEKIHWIAGKGGASNEYGYDDRSALPGVGYYYRLKMIDTDGSFAYSGVRNAMLGREWDKPTVTPNPTDGRCDMSFEAPAAGSGKLEISNSGGRKVFEQQITFEKGTNTVKLNLDLNPGTYVLQLTSGSAKWNTRVVISQ